MDIIIWFLVWAGRITQVGFLLALLFFAGYGIKQLWHDFNEEEEDL